MKKALIAIAMGVICLSRLVGAEESMPTDHKVGHGMAGMKGHDTSMKMNGFYGSYPMTREASGTAWQPESTPHEGLHVMAGEWMIMHHGFINGIYDRQGGRRGDDKLFSANMLMTMARRPLGPGTLGLRNMLSLEPATIGRQGYPLLFQTGETSDGKTPLIDRQHPHDLFMELAASYSVPVGEEKSIFGYFGLPGEPALGPATFMHRFSGADIPEAPLAHHWLDSTHITFGVGTLGYIWKNVKLEGSAFHGREPDENRWNIEKPRLDSYSTRLSYNPTPAWALQTSWGCLQSPEQLEPDTDLKRLTASAGYNRSLEMGVWQTTLAWGRNDKTQHHPTDAYLLESAFSWDHKHTIFGRAEEVDKDELFVSGPLAGESFNVFKASLGYIRDVAVGEHAVFGVGGLGSVYSLPSESQPSYGKAPLSFMLFARMKLI